MAKRSSKPRDVNSMAAAIVAQSVSDEQVPDPDAGKNPHAVALGRSGGLKGGRARADKLTADQRTAIAVKAARARWESYGKFIAEAHAGSLPEASATSTRPAVEPVTRLTENFTTRTRRLLQDAAPKTLTARQILNALEAEGWVTSSKTPMTIVRNTMADLCRRIPEFHTVKNPDGTVEYGWQDQPTVEGGG